MLTVFVNYPAIRNRKFPPAAFRLQYSLSSDICPLHSDICLLSSDICPLSSDQPLGSRCLISFRSDLAIRCGCRNDRLRLVVFLVSMWPAHDFRYTILPVPVFLKRLAAARFVLIFGIILSPLFKNRWREPSSIGSRHRHRIKWCS